MQHVAVLDDIALALGAEQAAAVDGRRSFFETEMEMAAARKTAKAPRTEARSEQDVPEEFPCRELSDLDDETLGALYAEFFEEDRALANMGLAEYAEALASLDREASPLPSCAVVRSTGVT